MHGILPVPVPAAIATQYTALDNLALAATNGTAVLQQLTAANLALTFTITMLTATNKKLVKAAAQAKGTPAGDTPAGTQAGQHCPAKNPHPSNFCWTHGHRIG